MKKPSITRRDFLKISSLASITGLASLGKKANFSFKISDKHQPNILILILDTLTARHVSIGDYPRNTTPNLSKFAEKSTIFHQHHASGNFTSPSTASLLTGTYPWTHRAINLDGSTLKDFKNKNIFSLLPRSYTSFGYTQNPYVEILLNQFAEWLDIHPPMEDGCLYDQRIYQGEKDYHLRFWGERIIRGEFSSIKPTFFIGSLIDLIQEKINERKVQVYSSQYPENIPNTETGLSFVLSESIQWLLGQINNLDLPFFAYVHLFPPHGPYYPSNKFLLKFNDSWIPPTKPKHVLADSLNETLIHQYRLRYDQYLAHTDDDFGILLESLEKLGYMDNSYIILTSDHGELFERGIWGHRTEVLYEPIVHVPLIVHKPGQSHREDIGTPTSILDILPTICYITGQPIPEWVEGEILPTFSYTPSSHERVIFCFDAQHNHKYRPLTIGTLAMIKWPYKLIYYFGYEELAEGYELYNLEEDPEEITDLFTRLPKIALPMKDELLTKLEEVNKTYQE